MTGQQDERLVKAVEMLAIAAVHAAAGWLALHLGSQPANWLQEQVEPKMDWRLQRYSK